MKSQKVAFFMRSANGGGAERVMISLANEFRLKGYDVDFVFVQAIGPFLKDIHPQIKIINLESKRALFSVFGLKKYIEQKQPDFLISALNYINLVCIVTSLLLPRNKVPKLIITEHGTLGAVKKNLHGIGRVIPFLMKRLYPFAHHIVAVSNGVADDLANQISIEREKIKVIYNPIDFNKIKEKKDLPLDHPWIQENAPIILGVGRLVEVKNFSLLIKAFISVREKNNCKLVILGEGEERETLQQLVNQSNYVDDIRLFGFTENPYQWMKIAKLFVLSSNTEGLPTVLIEALACGLQVISTDCPHGPREILDNGKYGALVEVGNQNALANEIENQIFSDLKETENLKEMLNCFTVTSIGEKYENLLQE